MTIGYHKAECQVLDADEVVLVHQLAGCLVPEVSSLIGYLPMQSGQLISRFAQVGPTPSVCPVCGSISPRPLLAALQPARIVNQFAV